MAERETLITKLERGRAEFAYDCATEGKEIIAGTEIAGEYYKDDKYKSYVKKIPSMILSNGLGQTLAFIAAKRKKEKRDKDKVIRPGDKNNPKNAYDLIYKQISDYIRNDVTARIEIPPDNSELVKWVISLDSYNYRYVTEEILAFLNWLKRFAEGIIETEET